MKRKASNPTSCCASAEAVASTGGSPGILGKAGVCAPVKRNPGHAIALAVAFILTAGFTMGASINYPGSQYNLEYDLETDMLKGKYYQAITKQTFDVVFLRYK